MNMPVEKGKIGEFWWVTSVSSVGYEIYAPDGKTLLGRCDTKASAQITCCLLHIDYLQEMLKAKERRASNGICPVCLSPMKNKNKCSDCFERWRNLIPAMANSVKMEIE